MSFFETSLNFEALIASKFNSLQILLHISQEIMLAIHRRSNSMVFSLGTLVFHSNQKLTFSKIP